MTEISEAARALADIIEPRPLVGPIIAHQMVGCSVQRVIDEAVRRAREEREKESAATARDGYVRAIERENAARPIIELPAPEPSPAPERLWVPHEHDMRPLLAFTAEEGAKACVARWGSPHRVVEYVRKDRYEDVNTRLTRLVAMRGGDLDALSDMRRERDKARAEVERLRRQLDSQQLWIDDAKIRQCVCQRPAFGPIPDEVCDKAADGLYLWASTSPRTDMRAALEAVRGELCQHEVVGSNGDYWLDREGDVWSDKPQSLVFAPLTPVLLVRDPSREVVK